MHNPHLPVDNSNGTNLKIIQEQDKFKTKRLTALVLICITAGYLAFGDHNQTLELIMLALAGSMIGASILQKYPPSN